MPDGTFAIGNTVAVGNAGGTGRPPRGKDVRWHLRRLLETDSEEILPVAFSDGERLAREAIEAAKLCPVPRKVREVKDLVETAYGTQQTVTQETVQYTPEQAAARLDAVRREREQLERGGK